MQIYFQPVFIYKNKQKLDSYLAICSLLAIKYFNVDDHYYDIDTDRLFQLAFVEHFYAHVGNCFIVIVFISIDFYHNIHYYKHA